MKTQEPVDSQMGSQESDHGKRSGTSRLATSGAVLVVILIVAASGIVYAQLAKHHTEQASASLPSGSWTSVLQGYTITSLQAAANDPAVLYACAMNSNGSTTPTVLSSSDYGTHWQNIGANIGLTSNCQLAVNPDNSSELYVIGATQTQNGQTINVLKHATDGGKTWTTITPSLKSPTGQVTPMWRIQVGNMQQISMVAGHLFAIEVEPFNVMPPVKPGSVPPYLNQLPRLITSSDGGQTWTFVDQQFASTQQGVTSYVVDPTNANTIYALFHPSWLPLRETPQGTGIPVPINGLNGELYKTTDGGSSWKLLLQNLALGSSVQLAQGNPQNIYVGGSRSPQPYAASNPGWTIPQGVGSFSLQMSNDGGTSWQSVPALAQKLLVNAWFVNQNGQVYIYSGNIVMQPQATAMVATAIATKAVMIPQGTPQTTSVSSQPHSMPMMSQPLATPTAAQAEIQRYDPASSQWSSVTKPPVYGKLLAVTPNSASSDILWYAGVSQGQEVLYRYVG
jgi:photosystem II stability/assembly factor-like uncharacterized protein